MKKAIAILLALVFIAAGGMLFVHNWVDGLGDDVTMKETVLAGDRKAAEGVTVTTSSHYEETPLFWDVKYRIGDENKLETRVSYDKKRDDSLVLDHVAAIGLSHSDAEYWSSEEEHPQFGYPMEMFQEIIDKTPAGGEKYGKVVLADYIDARIARVGGYTYHTKPEVEIEGTDGGRYFRFPMTEKSEISVHVVKDEEGEIREISTTPYYTYEVDSASVFSADYKETYIAVSDMSRIEEVADGMKTVTESVPLEEGICGIHRFPTTVATDSNKHLDVDVNMEDGTLVYPIKQGNLVERLWLSEDGSLLQMITYEEGDIWFTALDSKNYEEKQRMRLFTHGKNMCTGVVVIEEMNSMAIFFDDNHVALFKKGENSWKLEGVDKLYYGDYISTTFSDNPQDKFAVAFDGSRVAIVDAKPVYAGSYYLWIYEEGKCKYAGEYDCSLGEVGYHQTDDAGLRYTYQNSIKVALPSEPSQVQR